MAVPEFHSIVRHERVRSIRLNRGRVTDETSPRASSKSSSAPGVFVSNSLVCSTLCGDAGSIVPHHHARTLHEYTRGHPIAALLIMHALARSIDLAFPLASSFIIHGRICIPLWVPDPDCVGLPAWLWLAECISAGAVVGPAARGLRWQLFRETLTWCWWPGRYCGQSVSGHCSPVKVTGGLTIEPASSPSPWGPVRSARARE